MSLVLEHTLRFPDRTRYWVKANATKVDPSQPLEVGSAQTVEKVYRPRYRTGIVVKVDLQFELPNTMLCCLESLFMFPLFEQKVGYSVVSLQRRWMGWTSEGCVCVCT
jgi:hypothetical protein